MPIKIGQPIPDIRITSNAFQVAEQLGMMGTVLIPALTTAMSQSLDVLQFAMVNSMYRLFEFDPRPSTGVLEGGFYQTVTPGTDSVVGELINPVAYAWRRQAGFDGMTDSLGRTYALDPIFRGSLDYMGRGLRNTQTRKRMIEIFTEGVYGAMIAMGAAYGPAVP